MIKPWLNNFKNYAIITKKLQLKAMVHQKEVTIEFEFF